MFFNLAFRICFLLTLPVLVCGYPNIANAIPWHYFTVSVPVSGQGEAERNKLFKQAIQTLLYRLSGNDIWTDTPAIMDIINHADRYVDRYSYSNRQTHDALEPDLIDSSASEDLHIRFGRIAIERLLKSNHYPVWTDPRPPVLIWTDTQNTDNASSVPEDGHDLKLRKELSDAFKKLALLPEYPLMDFTDMKSLPKTALNPLDKKAVLRASKRYQTPAVMIINAYTRDTSSFSSLDGKIVLFFQGNEYLYSFDSSSVNAVAKKAASLAIGPMAQFYGADQKTKSDTWINVTFKHVDTVKSYLSLLDYLKNRQKITSVIPLEFGVNYVRLKLKITDNGANPGSMFYLDSHFKAVNMALYDAVPPESAQDPLQSSHENPVRKKHHTDFLFEWNVSPE